VLSLSTPIFFILFSIDKKKEFDDRIKHSLIKDANSNCIVYICYNNIKEEKIRPCLIKNESKRR